MVNIKDVFTKKVTGIEKFKNGQTVTKIRIQKKKDEMITEKEFFKVVDELKTKVDYSNVLIIGGMGENTRRTLKGLNTEYKNIDLEEYIIGKVEDTAKFTELFYIELIIYKK